MFCFVEPSERGDRRHVSLRSGNVPSIRFTWKYHDIWRNLSTWRFYVSTLSFEPNQHSNFSRKHRRQNFEEQNEYMTSLNRWEKAAESNTEWKKKKAPEFLWRNSVRESSNLTVPNKHHALQSPYEKKGSDFKTLAISMYSEAPWTQVNFKGIKEWKGLKSLAERNSTNQPNITCKWFAWYLLYRNVIFKNLLHSDTSVLSSHTWIKT